MQSACIRFLCLHNYFARVMLDKDEAFHNNALLMISLKSIGFSDLGILAGHLMYSDQVPAWLRQHGSSRQYRESEAAFSSVSCARR